MPGLLAMLLAPVALAQTPCPIDEVQRLFTLQPRPVAQLDGLLSTCAQTSPSDYRVDLLRGVLAREAGHLPDAIALLGNAHRLAPNELAPSLELAVSYEWNNQPEQALALYQDVLRRLPDNRAALLGSARVARQQTRLNDAEAIYNNLLKRDPNDHEAQGGLAWVALQRKQFASSRAQFAAVLANHPDDQDAQTGLKYVNDAWRYQLDVAAQSYSLAAGQSNGVTSQLQMAVNETDTVLLGYGHNHHELPTQNPNDPTPLASDVGRIGFIHRVPDRYFWSLAYEYRERDDLDGENQLAVSFGSRLAADVSWFAGLRQGFPSPWKNRLWHAGINAPTPWQGTYTTVTGYVGDNEDADTSKAVVVDLTHEGEHNLLLSAGLGYAVDPDVFIVHARTVWPISAQQALTFSIEHRSFGDELEASLGWRVYWQ